MSDIITPGTGPGNRLPHFVLDQGETGYHLVFIKSGGGLWAITPIEQVEAEASWL